MTETRLGKVVYIERAYTVAEVLEVRPEGVVLVGYSVFGYGSDTGKIYSREEALEALRVLAEASPSKPRP